MTGDAIEIVPAGPDQLTSYAELAYRSFLDSKRPSAAVHELLRKQSSLYRFKLARIGTVTCGAFRSWDLDLPVPGARTVPIRAIGAVAVLSTHRRRGVASAFVRGDLAEAREQGAVLSHLIPSEAGIYGRFGFGAATETVRLTVHSPRVRFAENPGEKLELEATDDAGIRDVAPPLHRDAALRLPGALPRPDLYWDRACGLVGDADESLHRPALIARTGDGTVVGTASYRVEGDWTLDRPAALRLLDLTAVTPAAYRALWEHLAQIDLTDRIVAADRPVHEPLPWMLTDRRAVAEAHRTDFQWIRVLDVPAALAGRVARTAGSVVLEVLDPLGFAAGRWLVDADEAGRTTVTPTSRPACLTLPVQTLSSVYLGQNSLIRLHLAGLADEHRPGAVAELDRMTTWSPTGLLGHTWF
ncbi:GNAT family N-acetyltransferase [Kineosporia sp. J2-2]|uniref:GNAT family N-acetyltransferase n=1 Tax=Kineosporia corallincola TaxID=2835133 RepID=A0ABS5TR55_9ACTN|nr:GNAT family N-acetyltransferase [Kineosporia corallincola]MBT0772689.1 GNAT family N-acetyltransferase [Kineosporia corallincola]